MSTEQYVTNTQEIYQLERQLANYDTTSDVDVTKKIDAMNNLAWALSDTDLKRAQSLSESAYSLAESTGGGTAPYQMGMAYSLRTQGYLNQRLGDYALGLAQLFKAQAIFESLRLDEGLPDVFDGIAGIYYQIGNFPETLDYIYRQLEAAQRINDSRRVANAYNNLANIYFETGDYERAIETLHHNLQLAAETDYKRIECLSYLNLAETYLLADDHQQGLDNALRGLEVSPAAGFELFEVYAFDLVGKAYLKLGDAGQAMTHLEQALALSRKIESKVTESLILLNIGQAYRDMQQFENAIDYIRQGLSIAQAIDAKSELVRGHLLLSETYEQQGNLAQALHHFKQHHTFKELVFNEKADLRLKVLQVAHDTKTARQQAEIHRLQNVELKREIAERQRQAERLRLMEAVVKHIVEGVLVTEAVPLDPPGPRIIYVNQAMVTMTGYAKEELMGQNPRLLQGPKTDRWVLDQVREALERKQPVTVELINYSKAGQEFWIELSMSPVVNGSGETTHFVAIQRDISARKKAEEKLQQQIDYEEALARYSRTLLMTDREEIDNRRVLVEALQHLVKPAQASKIYLYENYDDPELGFCSRFIVDACAPGIPSLLEDPNPRSQVIPWSAAPDENRRRLAAGEPVGGPVKRLFASTPPFRDFLLNKAGVLSVQFFPIHFGDYWWGYIGFDDRLNEREWGEGEVLLLRTAAEILSNTLQRWQAEDNLQSANERLEQQVEIRTTELSDTVSLLQQEIKERERAESETQHLLVTLEERVAARTEELATFFDLTLLAGHTTNLNDVLQQVIPRILEVIHSQAICLHLLEAGQPGLQLTVQENLPFEAQPLLQAVDPPPQFQQWLQQPREPLVTTTLSEKDILPPAFRLEDFHTYLGAQIRTGHQVKGLLSCYRFDDQGFSLDEISLIVALAEQIGVMLEIHLLRQNVEEMAVFQERQRLARDLHDSVTQALYSLTLFARSGQEAMEDGDAARLTGSLADIEQSARGALRQMRLLLYELRAPLLEQEGLVQALDTRLNLVERRTGLQVEYHTDFGPHELPKTVELELYPVAIEALNNVAKHASASKVTVRLQAHNGHLRLTIADDGLGFDPRAANGFGLRGMAERVERLGGRLGIVSAPGQGAEISVEVNLDNE